MALALSLSLSCSLRLSLGIQLTEKVFPVTFTREGRDVMFSVAVPGAELNQ